MATFDVLLFSVLKQKVGEGRLRLHFEAPVTGEDLLDHLVGRYPIIGDYRSVVRLAVNQEYVPGTVVLQEGDEVALITPVSGG